ncbi:MAG: BfmA/BtgA family mobilization protein [Flavobacteriaceae bacterium]|nr:BfmA/BtgA family mobilization protein [Flavobacteriaceae bacterium]
MIVFHEKILAALINRHIFHEKMDKGYEKERFISLSVKSSVAGKFRKYSRGIGQSQSMTLLLMIEFFEDNNIAPTETMGPRMQTLESSIKKRINGLIAIIRDIEQNQTLPTKGMLQAIFEELPNQTKKKVTNSFEEAFKNLTRNQSSIPKSQPEADHTDIRKILSRLKEIKPSFGKSYWKLSLTSSEINHLKSKYHVHHH